MKVLKQTSSLLRVETERPGLPALWLAPITTVFTGALFAARAFSDGSHPLLAVGPIMSLLVAAVLWYGFFKSYTFTTCTVDCRTRKVTVARRSTGGSFEHVYDAENIEDVLVQVTLLPPHDIPAHALALRLTDASVVPLSSVATFTPRAHHDEFATLLRGFLARTRKHAA
ncbi:hypothetical protein [Myxococcus stipitatus]|uniref:hypothetical protein n=1 Tax=Myxococcus stipitatus TaxID=83455 RepID=UPI0030D47A99